MIYQSEIKNSIAVFDSGLGGLSVLCDLCKLPELANEKFFYFADRDCPRVAGARRKGSAAALYLHFQLRIIDCRPRHNHIKPRFHYFTPRS